MRKNDKRDCASVFQFSTSIGSWDNVNFIVAEVPVTLTAFRDWYWIGSPERRLIVHLFISAVVAAVPLGALGVEAKGLLVIFVSWDFGASFMDRIYIARLAAQQSATAQ